METDLISSYRTGTRRDFNARENPAEIFDDYSDRWLTKISFVSRAICI